MQLCVASYSSAGAVPHVISLSARYSISNLDLRPISAFDIMSEAAASQPAQPSSSSTAPTVLNKHAPTPLEQQRLQLERLLKDPSKPVHIPKPPVEKTLRTPREMMKNVQGSSAGESSFCTAPCWLFVVLLMLSQLSMYSVLPILKLAHLSWNKFRCWQRRVSCIQAE